MSAREERLLTPKTIAAVDQWLDEADVFAKGYWQYVDGKLTTVGLRIGQDWDKVVAFFGDTIVRHEDGSHTVLSAKDAAELAALRAERHSTNEALSDAAEQLRVQRDRIAELEAYAYGCDAEGCVQPHSSWCEAAQKSAAENSGCTCGETLPHAMHCWKVNPPRSEVEEMRRALAERPLLRQPEDPHDGPNHHDYALSRDLPLIPRQVTGRCPNGHTFEDCTCGGTPR
jgi:hypothetical protein